MSITNPFNSAEASLPFNKYIIQITEIVEQYTNSDLVNATVLWPEQYFGTILKKLRVNYWDQKTIHLLITLIPDIDSHDYLDRNGRIQTKYKVKYSATDLLPATDVDGLKNMILNYRCFAK